MSNVMNPRSVSRAVLLIGILLIAANLRAPITGLPAVIGPIRTAFDLSTAAAGALTTLPLLAFALISPFGAMSARKYGLERSLFGALTLIAVGIVIRSAGAPWSLYLGTWIIGMGIAIGNVLLPSIVKRDFPDSVAALTGAYVLVMGAVAALGSVAVVPSAHAVGWRYALAGFFILPLCAMAVWITQLRGRTAPAATTATLPHGDKVWRSALAWQVTLFLGLNATIYYVAISWLPTILIGAGMSPTQAGSMHGALQLATAVPGLVLGPILRRLRDQRLPAVAVAVFATIGLLGFMVAPQLALLWAILFGVGTGAGIMLGLTFIGLRTRNAHQAAALSGMSQCIGYLLAAVGPMSIGALHDALGGWQVPLGVCVILAIISGVVGLLAGRDRRIGT